MMIYPLFPGGLERALTFSYDDALDEDLRLAGIFSDHGPRIASARSHSARSRRSSANSRWTLLMKSLNFMFRLFLHDSTRIVPPPQPALQVRPDVAWPRKRGRRVCPLY